MSIRNLLPESKFYLEVDLISSVHFSKIISQTFELQSLNFLINLKLADFSMNQVFAAYSIGIDMVSINGVQ